jgi:hypothetical protein
MSAENSQDCSPTRRANFKHGWLENPPFFWLVVWNMFLVGDLVVSNIFHFP